MLAAYLRVSTSGQDLTLQRDAITRVCKARGERVEVWISEKTGGAGARDGLSRLLEQVRSAKVTKVYVWRLDRLSRGGILEVFNIVAEFRRVRCGLESVSEGFSLDHPASDLVLAVMASFAEMEREAIRARLAEARVKLEADGGAWGRPRAIDRPTLATIHRMQKRGDSVRTIAIALKIPRSTIANYLSGKTPPPRNRK
jgi:DNA invertase Pin-like site-specific DNA recombinase